MGGRVGDIMASMRGIRRKIAIERRQVVDEQIAVIEGAISKLKQLHNPDYRLQRLIFYLEIPICAHKGILHPKQVQWRTPR